jgi:hypothetical protein
MQEEKLYFYDINPKTRTKEYYKILDGDKVYNQYDKEYVYFHATVTRCKKVLMGEYNMPIDDFKNKEFKRVEIFKLVECSNRKIQYKYTIDERQLTTNTVMV